MNRITKITTYLLIILISILRIQITIAREIPTLEETINYLETKVPEAAGIKTYFSARLLDKQVEGTKRENYKLKIVNRELLLIEKFNSGSAKTIKGNKSLSTSQTRITEVIKMENVDPKIILIYKTNPTEGDDAMKAVYPPHIKIKIKAKPTYRWKVYKNDIEQVAAILNQSGGNFPKSHFEVESSLLLTTDETAAENIAMTLSHLIVLCWKDKQKKR